MKRLKIGAAFAALLATGAPVAATASTAHNIVLVPGAFTDKSCWDNVARLLRAKGFKVTEVDIPMTSLESDVAADPQSARRSKGCDRPGRSFLGRRRHRRGRGQSQG